MGINKVVLGDETLLDLTNDTVISENLMAGVVAHSASGDEIVGTMAATTAIYDLVIRTQEEFEEMYNSETWLDATSVCFVGDGGELEFTRSDGQGLKIPPTVKNIQGLNCAKINVTEFVCSDTNQAAIWYEDRPGVDEGYWIDGLEVDNIGTEAFAFYNCTNVTNCTGTGIGNDSGIGFSSCTNIINCIGTGEIYGYGYSYGFSSCTQLTNCIGTGSNTSNGTGIGFYSSTQLTNCTGTGTGDIRGYGFHSSTQLTNCTGTGTNLNEEFGHGYGFYNCKWVNGCKQGETASTTGFTGGAMLHVDDATVAAT